MERILNYNEFVSVNEKLVYSDGKKKSARKKSSNIVGYLEMVTVPQVGDFVAKFDSGNGSVSSITYDTYEIDGDYVIWTLNGKTTRSKRTKIAIVANKDNEQRVGIELDIIFNGVKYEKIPFTLADRSKNYAKMLVNRTFVNTIHGVIDTSSTFIVTDRPEGYSVNKKSRYSGIVFLNDEEEE